MRRSLFVLLLLAAGCSDVGDSSAVPGSDAELPPEVVDGVAPISPDATSSVEAGGAHAGPMPDAGGIDATITGGGGVTDAGVADTTVATESGSADAAEADVEADVAPPDATPPDATLPDSGQPETGAPADGGLDAARIEGGAEAGHDGGADSGTDGSPGRDAGAEGGGALTACTSAGQSGCVQCQGNTGGACTPTEALIVAYDIGRGSATAPGPDPAAGCYTCLFMAGGLDDVTFGDTNHECGDLSGTTIQTECLTTIGCILGSSCAKAEVSACYCGTAPVSGSCTSGGANGACDSQEAAGLGFAESDGLDILKNFTATTLPSGVANNVFQAALSNGCSRCVQ